MKAGADNQFSDVVQFLQQMTEMGQESTTGKPREHETFVSGGYATVSVKIDKTREKIFDKSWATVRNAQWAGFAVLLATLGIYFAASLMGIVNIDPWVVAAVVGGYFGTSLALFPKLVSYIFR